MKQTFQRTAWVLCIAVGCLTAACNDGTTDSGRGGTADSATGGATDTRRNSEGTYNTIRDDSSRTYDSAQHDPKGGRMNRNGD